ncbi:unnamed protein product [Symbiodinium necroappetens]|uniref:Amidohydrolase-related domain-containing protein n=1 Tax=Symbiodinium necroappetens TaxID=1628268 RepID=A0A812LRU0_9DINO|nr:unnamed protein product [Symbiodinium necroappetens]
MPGLIDAHVHVEFSERFPLHDQPELSAAQLRQEMAERALRMLRSGITTARDLGGRNYAALGLRDAIRKGECLGPRLLCAGQPLTVPRGHCHQWGGEAGSLEEALAVVDRQVENRVDWIKVMATGGMRTPGTNVEEAAFSVHDLKEVVARATAKSLAVAAHAHGAQGVVHAVQAGCRTVEHCTWIAKAGQWGCVDASTVEAMARQGIAVAPTAHANWRSKPMGHRNYTRMCSALQQLRAAGIQLLASSDAGAIPGLPHDALHAGIQVLAEMARMTPVEALKAATSASAAVLGLEAECGRLIPRLSADFLVVAGNPTEDLGALGRPALVVVEGRRVEPLAPPPPWPKVARQSRVKKFIYVSAIMANGKNLGDEVTESDVYKNWNNFGSVLEKKLAAEEYIKKSGLDYTIIRPVPMSNDFPRDVGGIYFAKPDSLRLRDSDVGKKISRDDVGLAVLDAIFNPKASRGTFELVGVAGAPPTPRDQWWEVKDGQKA